MILTGKAKEAFLKHVYFTEDTSQVNESIETEITEEASCWLSNQDERFRHAIIISWLDSVGIYVDCPPHNNYGEFFSKIFTSNKSGQPICLMDMDMNTNPIVYYSRHQATEKAIERAVELFNGK